MATETYTIAQLAEAIKTRPSTIRYWVQVGLLRPVEVGENGYRLFDRTSLVRAKDIKRLRDERFTILEVKERLG
jgi:DNA-binding transcriptional MerR regulator